MVNVILYIAVTEDGFIADKNGGVSWLHEYGTSGESCGYEQFYSTIDAVVFGKKTYEQVLTFGPWPYPDKKSYIFTDETKAAINNKDVEFVTLAISQFIKDIEAKGIKRLWLMGGAKLAASFYEQGFIDEYNLFIVPKKLREGIPLLPAIVSGEGMELVDEVSWSNGIVQKNYVKLEK